MVFFCKPRVIVHIQNLVKRYDGRFVNNPIRLMDSYQVILTFDDMNNANKFNRMLNIVDQNYF